MTQINVVDWIYSKWYHKLIRTVIACACSVGVLYVFENSLSHSDWYVQQGLPLLLVSFFFYGPYVVILCKYNFLVSKYEPKKLSEEKSSSPPQIFNTNELTKQATNIK